MTTKAAFHPLTPERWPDLEALFGARGACGGCWCMWWRLAKRDFDAAKGAKNKASFRKIVAQGPPPGVLAYVGGRPAGWCAIAPRAAYPRLARARTLRPIDDTPVWSITCFFVDRAFRRQGLSVRLIEAAAEFARANGATVVEGYPVVAKTGDMPAPFAWTGLLPAYERAGFVEVARPAPTRPIVRRSL